MIILGIKKIVVNYGSLAVIPATILGGNPARAVNEYIISYSKCS